jgi:Kdo2-lipid IVA lauroyltransferase/acyltransferase
MMHRILAAILYGLLYFFSLMPLRLHYFISDVISFLLRYVIRYRRRVIYDNLSKCFPGESQQEYKFVINEFYCYLSDIFVEAIWQIAASDRAVCKVVGQEGDNIVDMLCQKHDKVLIVTGHFGNWELVSAMCGENSLRTPQKFSNNSIYLGYKKLESNLSDLIFRKIRQSLYKKFCNTGYMIESHDIIRNVIRNKGEKSIYVLIADQSPLPGKRVVTKFLGRPTLMMSGPEYIATKMDIPVVYLGMERKSRGHYLIHYDLISEHPAVEKAFFVTRRYAQLLERDIRNNRYNWLWSHKRWKRELTEQEREEYATL